MGVARTANYRPEIDGLRAIAILPVLFFHAGIEAFSGGFIGVDIFFVISGYLITRIVAGEIAAGRFTFAKFYERRVRRIFPALFCVLIVSTATAAVIFPPSDFFNFAKSLLAITLFASNMFFWRMPAGNGYFDTHSNTQVLLHTWTLSVEEQFYIFLPITLVAIARWAPGRVRLILATAVIASFAFSIWAVGAKPLGAFYLLPSRAWELLLGALLTLKSFPPISNRIAREALALAGVALIGFAVFTYTRDTPFPGIAALAPCIGAASIIYAADAGPCFVKSALGIWPLTFVGLISYSLYLWHWPLFAFARYFLVSDLDDAQTGAIVLASLVMAYASYRWIETPFRSPIGTWTRPLIFRFGALASLSCAGLALIILFAQGIPQRFDQQTLKLIADNTGRMEENGAMGGCTHWRESIHGVVEIPRCLLGAGKSRQIMFWGDSHVEMLQPSIKRLYNEGVLGNHGVMFAVADGCMPAESIGIPHFDFYCARFTHFAKLRAEQKDVDIVYIGFATYWDLGGMTVCKIADGRCAAVLDVEEIEESFLQELTEDIRHLRALGKAVVISLPFPLYDRGIPELEIHNAMFAQYGSTFVPHELDSPRFRKKIQDNVVDAGAVIFDPRKSLCDQVRCKVQADGVSLYTDRHHIALSQTGLLDAELGAALQLGIGATGQASIPAHFEGR